MMYLWTKHQQMFDWLLGVLRRGGRWPGACVYVCVWGGNVVLKGVIMGVLLR